MLYTYGNEFSVDETGQNYIGYFNTDGNEYYSGMLRWKESVKLLNKLVNNDSEKTSLVNGILVPNTKKERLKSIKIKTYYPILNDSDYTRGYFTRYFAKHKLNVPYNIIEISQDEYNTINNETVTPYILYYTISLDWVISDMNGKIDIAAVNRENIVNLEHDFPGISKNFINYMEFSKI